MKTQIERAAAISKMMNDFAKSRDTVNANVFNADEFVVCANDNAVMVLVRNESAIKFNAANTPRTYPASVAHSLARQWNNVHGAKHPVRVIPATEWKAERLAEVEKAVSDLFELAANNH